MTLVNKKIKNIIFDWSGVISDDHKTVYLTGFKMVESLGENFISYERFKEEFSLPYMTFWEKYLPGKTKKELDSLFAFYYKKVEPPIIIPDAGLTVKILAKNYHLAVLSSHITKEIKSEAERYGIGDCFKKIHGNIHNKIKAIKKVLKYNEFKPDETVYVGDMRHDIQAGKAANIKTIAVISDYEGLEKLVEEKPDFIIGRISSLLQILQYL